jgi:hypothetical protein
MVGARVITRKALLENVGNMYILSAVKRLLNRRNLKGKHKITQMWLPENSECISLQISVLIDINSNFVFSCSGSILGLHAQLFRLLQET